jgi:hypothetical protein
MPKKSSLIVVLFLGACLYSGDALAQDSLTVVDFPRTPPTLRELLAKADLAILGNVTAVSSLQVREADTHPRRLQQLDVLEVLKADSQNPSPDHVIVRQAGGTYRSGDREVAYAYPTRLMQVNEHVILFLKRVPNHPHQYDIIYGNDGFVHAGASDAVTALPSGLQKMPEFAGRSATTTAQLLAALRASRQQERR